MTIDMPIIAGKEISLFKWPRQAYIMNSMLALSIRTHAERKVGLSLHRLMTIFIRMIGAYRGLDSRLDSRFATVSIGLST